MTFFNIMVWRRDSNTIPFSCKILSSLYLYVMIEFLTLIIPYASVCFWKCLEKKNNKYFILHLPCWIPAPIDITGWSPTKYSCYLIQGNTNIGGMAWPHTLAATAGISKVPISAEANMPTCLVSFLATNLPGFCTIAITKIKLHNNLKIIIKRIGNVSAAAGCSIYGFGLRSVHRYFEIFPHERTKPVLFRHSIQPR